MNNLTLAQIHGFIPARRVDEGKDAINQWCSQAGTHSRGTCPIATRGCAQVQLHIIIANLQYMLSIANCALKMHEGLEIEQHTILRIAKPPALS